MSQGIGIVASHYSQSGLYFLGSDKDAINETDNNEVQFFLSGENIRPQALPQYIPYVITGVNFSDFVPGTINPQLTGFVGLDFTNILTNFNQTFRMFADCIPDGNKTLRVTLTSFPWFPGPKNAIGIYKDVFVEDTSIAPPSYTLALEPLVANETTNNTITATLITVGVPNNTLVPYTITGTVSADDFSPELPALSGFFEVQGATSPPDNTPLQFTRVFTLSADQRTEGNETFIMTLTSAGEITVPVEATTPIQSKQVTILDTSQSPATSPVGLYSIWLDGADPTTMYTTTFDDPTPINGLVRTWRNKANDLRFAGTSNTVYRRAGNFVNFNGSIPTLVANLESGMPGIVNPNNGITIFLVFRATTNFSIQSTFKTGGITSPTRIQSSIIGNPTSNTVTFSLWNTSNVNSLNLSIPYTSITTSFVGLVVSVNTVEDVVMYGRVVDSLQTTSYTSDIAISSGLFPFYRIGTPSETRNFDIAELVYYPTPLPDFDIQANSEYLINKWGLT